MISIKQCGAGCILFLFSIQAGSTPIAISEITCDLSSAGVSFTFNGTGNAAMVESQDPSTNFHLEAYGFDVLDQSFNGNGNYSAALSGASASAVSNNESSRNIAQATANQGYATAYSSTSSYLTYFVENVNSIALSMDLTTSLELSTKISEDYAYGYWDAYLGIFDYNGNNYGYNTLRFEQEAYGGEDFTSDNNKNILNLSHDFTSPFTGPLVIQKIGQAYAEVQTQISAPVPEPTAISLLALGMVMIAGVRKLLRRAQVRV